MPPEVSEPIAEVRVRARARRGFVDLTDGLCEAVVASGVREGIAVAYCRHTTCGLLINEWEDGALEDLRLRLDVLVPTGIYYAHDDPDRRTQNLSEDGAEPLNGAAHVGQMIMGGASQTIPVVDGRPLLGRWQRLLLFELDQPRDRTVVFRVIGDRAAG